MAELDQLRDAVRQELAALNRLRACGDDDRWAAGGRELSPASKVEFFRELFHGRPDVFATRRENSANGRSGYSPRCGNEWTPGVWFKLVAAIAIEVANGTRAHRTMARAAASTLDEMADIDAVHEHGIRVAVGNAVAELVDEPVASSATGHAHTSVTLPFWA